MYGNSVPHNCSPKIRCNRCKKYRSAVNGPAVFGVVQTQQTRLVNTDGAGRLQTKVPLNTCLMPNLVLGPKYVAGADQGLSE